MLRMALLRWFRSHFPRVGTMESDARGGERRVDQSGRQKEERSHGNKGKLKGDIKKRVWTDNQDEKMRQGRVYCTGLFPD